MRKFTQLALVSSLAFSAHTMAMQAMDDTALSNTTGQDGINIGIDLSKVEIDKVYVHDNDGLTNTAIGGTSTAGAISLDGVTVTRTSNTGNMLDLKIDSDGSSEGAFLNIAADIAGLDIKIGEIGVAASNTTSTSATNIRRGVTAGTEKAILSGLTVTTGAMDANIQLGSTPQGAMIKLNTVMQGGLEISDLGILDNANNGEIWIGKIQVADANSKDLKVQATVNVKENGLEVVNKQDAASAGTDIYIQSVALGTKPTLANGTLPARGQAVAGSIGDIEIQGLKTYYKANGVDTLGTVIRVSGR